jgi:thymidylate kinase
VSVVLHADDETLLARVPDSLRERNGVPEPEDAAAKERAAEIVRAAVGPLLQPGGLRTSVLGPGWSRDLDLHVSTSPDPARLRELGWILLDGLVARLGHGGEGRWAVIENGAVLALAEFHLDAPRDPVSSVLARCRRRGEVRAREVLELRALVRSGTRLPPDDPVLSLAAGVEAGLGGDVLGPWRRGPALPAPAALSSSPGALLSRRLRRLASPLRRRHRVVVAVSGLDGAGKSTLAGVVARDLRRVGLPVTTIWTRPGMRLRWLGGVGEVAKRLLRQDASAGVERIGGGERPGALASRRGLLGWTWSLLVALSFISRVRGEHRRERGILLYDRHLLDALVTLDVVYEGVHLGLHRALIRRLLPRADLTLLLAVPAATALARKPADMFVEAVLERQAERYAALRAEAPALRELDGTRPADELATEAFRLVAGIGPGR